MKFYDIFNGDADGICALHQLRLANPQSSELITGVKRDIALVERVLPKVGDQLTVLDISLRANARGVERALQVGAHIQYFDHHATGDLPRHPNFKSHIDTADEVCTSLLVDQYLAGRYRLWAVVAAFGDNLIASALRAAQPLEIDRNDLARLHELGEALNYNAYGETVDDLYYPPADLYHCIAPYADPRDFLVDEPVFEVLQQAAAEDLARAETLAPEWQSEAVAVYRLPDAAWSRRVNGVWSNRLTQAEPERAHAVLVAQAGGYRVNVRAPRSRPQSAEVVCSGFTTGGGRAAAAGINHLPEAEVSILVAALERTYATP